MITRLIVGGAQENTVDTVLGLETMADFRTELVSGPTPADLPEGTLQPRVDSRPGLLTLVGDLVRPISPLRDLRALLSLWRHFRGTRPHIVHTHSGKAGILGRLAARAAGVPIVVHTIHGPSFGPFQGPIANLVLRGAERIAGACTSHFVGVADAMCRQYLDAGIGRRERYSTVHSGFDIAPFGQSGNDPALRRRLGIGQGDLVIGKVARLVPLKGHEDLIAAAERILHRCPAARFLLVGDGPLRPHLESMIRTRDLSGRFTFTGLVGPEEVPGLIGITDMVVHLSRREGLPRSLSQALAAGKPVVAMDADGAGEVCRNGRTGYLVACGDTDALVDRVALLARDPGLRHRLGQRGRALVEKEFTTRNMVERTARLYRRLTSQGKLP